jgi:transposase
VLAHTRLPFASGTAAEFHSYTSMVKEQVKAGSNETITLTGCWAHVSRKFYELHIGGINHAATASVKAMAELWRVEDEARGKDAETRALLRQARSAAIIASLYEIWEKELAKVSGKSKTAEAIRYAMTRRQSLERFLTDGRIEIDSNIVERAIRPKPSRGKTACLPAVKVVAIHGRRSPTLLHTAKMNDVDPLAWLTQTLVRMANGWPAQNIEALMPWNFKPDGPG